MILTLDQGSEHHVGVHSDFSGRLADSGALQNLLETRLRRFSRGRTGGDTRGERQC